MSEANTHQHPEMERFVDIRPFEDKDGFTRYEVRLRVGSQSFGLCYPAETSYEAIWQRDMLCIALAKIVEAMKNE